MPSTFAAAGHGIVFSPSLMHSPGLIILSAFVLINTVMFLALAILKLLPRLYISDWITSPNRRAETRGIYPEPSNAVRTATAQRPVLTTTDPASPAQAPRHRAASPGTAQLPGLRRARPRHRRNRQRPH